MKSYLATIWFGAHWKYYLAVVLIFLFALSPMRSTSASLQAQSFGFHPIIFVPGPTALILENLEDTQALFSFALYNAAGIAVYTSGTDTLFPGIPKVVNLDEIPGIAPGVYNLIVSADRKVQSLIMIQQEGILGDNLGFYRGGPEPIMEALLSPIYKGANGLSSAIHVQNASAGPVDVSVQFYSLEGDIIAATVLTSVPANATGTIRADDFETIPAGFTGWAEVSATGNVFPIVETTSPQHYEFEEPIVTFETQIDSTALVNQYALPRLFKAFDEGAGSRTSQIVVVNPAEIQATVAITYTSSENTSFSAPLITLSPKEMRLVDLTNEAILDAGEIYSGIATSSTPVGINQVTYYDAGTPLPTATYRYPSDTEQFLPRLIQQGGRFSVFSIQNTGAVTATVFVTFNRLDGTSAGQTEVIIPAGGFVRLNTLDISLLSGDFEGGATISSVESVAVQVDEYVVSPNPVPSITSLSPNTVNVGRPGFTLTVNGSNFVQDTTVQWNGTPITTTFISSAQLKASVAESNLTIPKIVAITVENPPPGGGTSNSLSFTITDKTFVYLPLSIRNWPPQAVTPQLQAINNADQDNIYTVNWANPSTGATYILEEAWNADFTNAGLVYQGTSLSWIVPTGGKLPGTYFYRVKARNAYNESPWSTAQSIRIYPLYVGLQASWDGKGFIRTDDYYDVGTHDVKECDLLTDPETIRCTSNFWYSPNPEGWASEYWNTYYSVTTGEWKGTDGIGDPSWQWGHSWKLAYDSYFTDGTTVKIDGQQFTVTGPHWGYTTYGKAIQYWEFINKNKFLYNDSGGDWTQYVHPGDVILRYDAGGSGLIIYDSVLRHYYYQDELSPYTVQYIDHLSSATSLPGSPPVAMFSSAIPLLEQPSIDKKSLEDGLGLPRD